MTKVDKSLTDAVNQLNKQYGENFIRLASELPPVRMFPTTLAKFDLQTGGGLPLDRISIIAGQEDSGKTSLAWLVAGQAQKNGFPILYLDPEQSFDTERAKLFGFDTKREDVFVTRDVTAQSAFEVIRVFLQSYNAENKNKPLMIILDSLSSLVNDKLFEDDGKMSMGGNASVNNNGLKLTNVLLCENQFMILINQFIDNIGSLGEVDFLPGGRGQRQISPTIIWMRSGQTLKSGNDPIGKELKWTIKKLKTGFEKVTGQVNFYFETGFDLEDSLVDTAIEIGLVQKSGAWLTLPNGDRIQGKDKFVEKMRNDKDFMEELRTLVYSKMNYPLYKNKEEIKNDLTEK